MEGALNRDWAERERTHDTAKAEAAEAMAIWQGEVKQALKLKAAPPPRPDNARAPDPPQRRRFSVRDATTQRLAKMMAANPRGLLLFRDELAGWIGGMDRYDSGKGADRAFWLEAHGGGRFTVDTVKDGDAAPIIEHLTTGIIGALTLDKARAALGEADNDGLAARFLYAWPAPRRPSIPKGEPPEALLRDGLMKLAALPWEPPDPVLLPFTEAAQAIIQARREAVSEADESGLLGAWMGKMAGAVVRLAVIFQHLAWLADGGEPPQEIGENATARADGLLGEYFLPMAVRFFGVDALPASARDARLLAKLIQGGRVDRLNSRLLARSGPIRDVERVKAALLDLEAAGWVRRDPARAGEGWGRARDDWEIRPDLLAQLAQLSGHQAKEAA
jgi:hypothetical protein